MTICQSLQADHNVHVFYDRTPNLGQHHQHSRPHTHRPIKKHAPNSAEPCTPALMAWRAADAGCLCVHVSIHGQSASARAWLWYIHGQSASARARIWYIHG